MKRLLVVLLGALLLALALGASVLVFLAATASGTRFLADQAERFLPVRFESVSGALLGRVRIAGLTVSLEDRQVRIEDLGTEIGLWPLIFENRLVISSLRAGRVLVGESSAPPDPGPPPPLELPYLPLSVVVRRAVVEHLEVAGVPALRIDGAAAWNDEGLVLRRLAVVSEDLVVAGSGRLGTGSNPTLSASVSWSLPDLAWGGAGRIDGRVDALELTHTLSGLVSGEAAGSASLADVLEPEVDLEVRLADMRFGDTVIQGLTGRLTGTLANLVAQAGARVATPGVAPFDVTVHAYGPAGGPLTIRNVSADALGGSQEAQGSVSWEDAVLVQLGGRVESVSLAGWVDGLTGRISGAVQFSYGDGRLGLLVEELSGTVNQRPLSGRLQVAQSSDGWTVGPFQLAAGANRVQGELVLAGEEVALTASLAAPELEALDLGVRGDAVGRVQLAGPWPALSGVAELSGSALEGFGAALAEFQATARLDAGHIDADAAARWLRREALEVQAPRLEADGTTTELRWRASWNGGAADGELARDPESVLVRVADLRQELLGETWRLQDVAEVRIGPAAVAATGACFAGGDAAVCVRRFAWRDGVIDTAGELRRAPVAMLRPWLPLRLEDSAYLQGDWTLAGALDDLSGDLTLAARGLAVRPGTQVDAVALPDLEASGVVGGGALNLRLTATGEDFLLQGRGRLSPLAADGALSGTLRAEVADIAPLKVFDQRLEELAGAVTGEIVIGGTLQTPRLDGQMRLSDGRFKVTDPGVDLDQVDLLLDVNQAGRFQLAGTLRQDDDQLSVSASGSGLFDDALALEAALAGEGIELEHPDWEVTLSPDLSFSYADGNGTLGGRVTVPEAEVRVNTLPASVPSVSPDVVVVGREEAGGGAANPVRINVEIVLGEDVELKALGITAELEGSLRARLGAQGRARLNGTVAITGGILSTQGQVLEIESGSVAYNGPIDRPYIDLRAVREIDDTSPPVTVGLHISGSASNLTSSVFSEPAMSDTRALSYLVLGRDFNEESTDSDSGQLMAAAINLGLSQSKGITGELMRLTGLDELSASAEAEDDFSIVAGKRVTDDLYVRYTYNTLSAVGAFMVRYDLGKRWQLEAASGEKSSMDLMYHIQK